MTLNDILSLNDQELYAAFWKTQNRNPEKGYASNYYWNSVGHRFDLEAEAWANAPAPESSEWLPCYDLAVEAGFRFEPTATGLGIFKDGEDFWCEGSPSAALMRAVLACCIYINQENEK